jgi:acyl-CoA thioesterase FadM
MTLNPKFVFFSPVRNAAGHRPLIEHVDHAIIALDGRAPVGGDWSVEPLHPVENAESLRVELWVSDLGDFTCTYGFVVTSVDGCTAYARGERTVVNVDSRSHQAVKWSNDFRDSHTELRKDLPAYA